MLKLIEPTEAYLASYEEAYREYVEKGVSTYSFTDASTRKDGISSARSRSAIG